MVTENHAISSDEHLPKKYQQKRLKLAIFWPWGKGSREEASEEPTALQIHFSRLSKKSNYQLGAPAYYVFHTSLFDRFIEIQSNHRRMKLHRMNQGSKKFLGDSFSNRYNVRVPMQFYHTGNTKATYL